MKHIKRVAILGEKPAAYLALTGAMSIAGSSVVAAKAIACLPIFLSCAASLILAVLVMLPLASRQAKGARGISRRDKLFLLLQALAGVFIFRVALFHGLQHTSAMAAGVIVSTLPALTVIISLLLLKDGLTWRKAAGVLLAVAGLLLVNVPGAAPAGGGRGPGANLLVFGAVMGEAFFTVLQKKVAQDVPPIAATARICLYALLFFLPGALFEARHFDFKAVRPPDLLFLAYYGLIVTALALSCSSRGRKPYRPAPPGCSAA